MTVIRVCLVLLAVACGGLSSPGRARAAEDPPQALTAAAGAPLTIIDADRTAAKAIFAAQCGWCHGSYGMTPDKGPRLAGTRMTQAEVENRIRNGKTGYMPSFKRFLNDDEIALMARYIKSLPSTQP